jgi:predicted RNA-binding Zn ribbon-like protein
VAGQPRGLRAAIPEPAWRRERALPQPGDRPPAPGPLAVVQAFINTHFDLVEHWRADRVGTPEALAGWLTDRGLLGKGERQLGRQDVQRARQLREALRATLQAGAPPCPETLRDLNHAVRGVELEIRFTPAGPELVPADGRGLAGALAALVSVIVAAAADGTWWRLKACPGEHCGWVFFDASRNNSGRWCSMSVCGGRSKARSHYRRARGRTP